GHVQQALGDEARQVARLDGSDLDLRLVAFGVEDALYEHVAAEAGDGDLSEGLGGAIRAKHDLEVFDRDVLVAQVVPRERGRLLFGQAEGDGFAGLDARYDVVPVGLECVVGRGRRGYGAVD